MSIASIGNVASLAAQLSSRIGHSVDAEPGCGRPVPGHHGPHVGGLLSQALTSALDKVALNPQPLPPHDGGGLSASTRFTDGEGCGNVPHKVPHWPPPPPVWSGLNDITTFVGAAAQR
jgi:hypothetical protein